MRYLLFNWEYVGHTEDAISDVSELSNEQFENLARKYGLVYETYGGFESGFNAELFSTHTHQLRIINQTKN
mgnify:CR=1 FL=1|tara:strand:- start:1777 stop:1989 length:213 start_codon:yes stop_codon:yes gene_type:complete